MQERVDLAVRAGRVTEPNLIARKLMPSDFQLAAHPGNDIDCDDVTELEAYPFVLYRKRGQTQVLRLERGSGDDHESVELTVSGPGQRRRLHARWSSSSPRGRASA